MYSSSHQSDALVNGNSGMKERTEGISRHRVHGFCINKGKKSDSESTGARMPQISEPLRRNHAYQDVDMPLGPSLAANRRLV